MGGDSDSEDDSFMYIRNAFNDSVLYQMRPPLCGNSNGGNFCEKLTSTTDEKLFSTAHHQSNMIVEEFSSTRDDDDEESLCPPVHEDYCRGGSRSTTSRNC